MATQIRKFEQDAIVDTIYKKIEDKAKLDMQSQLKSKEFKALTKLVDKRKSLHKEVRKLEHKMTDAQNEARDILKGINESLADKSYTISCGYSCNKTPSIDFNNSWSLKSEIANKIAISLLPKDAIQNIDAIIESIVKELG
jgi:hypothetical protein